MDDSTLGSGLGYFICVPEIETSWKQASGAAHHPFCSLSKTTAKVGAPFDHLSFYPGSFAHFSSMEKMNQGPQSHGCWSKLGFRNKTQQESEREREKT